MAKPLRNLLITVLIIAVLGGGAWYLLKSPPLDAQTETTDIYLVQKQAADVAQVQVSNQNGDYTVIQQNGSCTVHDIPADVVNTDYVDMLLDECSNVYYQSVVNENPDDLSLYGLQQPTAEVYISYTDGTVLQLLFGAEEPLSGGRYFKTADSDAVLLMKNSRTIRFTMPVEKYINYIIIEPNQSTSILSAVQDIAFSGTQLPEPIVLKAVLEDREEIKREASSFGAVTHLITSPVVHEADQTELITITESLLGLISEGVVDYNCTEEELAAYGFAKPALQVEFDYQNGKDAKVKHFNLKLAVLDGGYIATLEGQGIVYKIADVAFTQVSYENLISRWFLSPFITDVKTLEISFDGETYAFDMESETSKELVVTQSGKELDSELFRKYYNLIVTAAAEGDALTDVRLPAIPEMTVRFIYKDTTKTDDVMDIYAGDVRRAYVEVNGTCEFSIREKYVSCIKTATVNVVNGQIFSLEW
ncbi:DUF4340 domain-containing protein [Oscillospiraceae bacterium PP1C4]